MNDGICRYRGILQPSAASKQSDTSQMASIYLSNNRESYHIKQFAKCGVCECFFFYFFIYLYFFLLRHDSKLFENNWPVRRNYEVIKMKCMFFLLIIALFSRSARSQGSKEMKT